MNPTTLRLGFARHTDRDAARTEAAARWADLHPGSAPTVTVVDDDPGRVAVDEYLVVVTGAPAPVASPRLMTALDHPGVAFLQARGFTPGRPDGPPLWLVWHDMEAPETADRAESTAAYFANPGDDRDVSAHYNGDANSVVQSVRETDTAWAVGNRAGNNRGISFELAGQARQSRAEWLDPYGLAMFAQVCPVAAAAMSRWHLPARWCTVADLKALRPGMTTHNDLRVAFGQTTHTDPGTGFPRDHVLDLIRTALGGPPVSGVVIDLMNTTLSAPGKPYDGYTLNNVFGTILGRLPGDLGAQLVAILAAANHDPDVAVNLTPQNIATLAAAVVVGVEGKIHDPAEAIAQLSARLLAGARAEATALEAPSA